MSHYPPNEGMPGRDFAIDGQAEVAPDDCPECGGWLHRELRNGYEGPHRLRFCDPDCIAEFVERNRASSGVGQ